MEHSFQISELNENLIEPLVQYWTQSGDDHLISMGVDITKKPKTEELRQMLRKQCSVPDHQKSSLAFIAFQDTTPIGHCNVNEISYGSHAKLHLHIWDHNHRNRGLGTEMLKRSIPLFFKRLQLEKIYCEPYAENDAPNKTLVKFGFQFVGQYKGIPGAICFEQLVNKYVLLNKNA